MLEQKMEERLLIEPEESLPTTCQVLTPTRRPPVPVTEGELEQYLPSPASLTITVVFPQISPSLSRHDTVVL
jgi:hypothetical protein